MDFLSSRVARATLDEVRRTKSRRSLSSAALVMALVIAILVGPGSFVHDVILDDPACLPLTHDATAHRVGRQAEEGSSHQSHCFICHWSRANTALQARNGHSVAPPDELFDFNTALVFRQSRIDESRLSARAPPA